MKFKAERSLHSDQSGNKLENKEKISELEYIPIFRSNDLYAELFPDIKATFEKGEVPNSKK